MGHYDSRREEFDKVNEFMSSNPKEEQQFFVELRKVLYRLAKERSSVCKAVFTVSYDPPGYKGCDSFNLSILDQGFVVESFKSIDLKDIVSNLKSFQEPEPPEEIIVKGKRYKLVEDVPKIASREDRYNAVMKYNELVINGTTKGITQNEFVELTKANIRASIYSIAISGLAILGLLALGHYEDDDDDWHQIVKEGNERFYESDSSIHGDESSEDLFDI